MIDKAFATVCPCSRLLLGSASFISRPPHLRYTYIRSFDSRQSHNIDRDRVRPRIRFYSHSAKIFTWNGFICSNWIPISEVQRFTLAFKYVPRMKYSETLPRAIYYNPSPSQLPIVVSGIQAIVCSYKISIIRNMRRDRTASSAELKAQPAIEYPLREEELLQDGGSRKFRVQ